MSISLIAAIGKNNCIGRDGTLPWHLPEDLKHFKKLTLGKYVLMGRKTWESLPEKFRPLPGRHNIVVTRQPTYALPENVECFSSIEACFHKHAHDEIVVIGGGELYKQTIELAHTLFITKVDQEITYCDAFFPQIDTTIWHEYERDNHEGFSFITYKNIVH